MSATGMASMTSRLTPTAPSVHVSPSITMPMSPLLRKMLSAASIAIMYGSTRRPVVKPSFAPWMKESKRLVPFSVKYFSFHQA